MKTLIPAVAMSLLAIGASTAARADDAQFTSTLTREDVRAEAIRARHDGEILEGRSSLTPREQTPDAYPAKPTPSRLTRSDVHAASTPPSSN